MPLTENDLDRSIEYLKRTAEEWVRQSEIGEEETPAESEGEDQPGA